MSRIFISYRRQDSEGYVGRLYDQLVNHFERGDIFMDVDSIKPGQDFVQVLEDAVTACQVFITVIGPYWLNVTDADGKRRLDQWNDFVRIELAAAFGQGKIVIPVLVQRARMPSPDDLPDDIKALARRNAIELTHERFGYDVGKLVDAITEVLRTPGKAESDAAVNKSAVRPLSPEKEAAMKAFREDLMNLTDSPLYAYRRDNNFFPVPGEGSLDAHIMFIGEAPGQYEVEVGRPFYGPSGEVFDELLASVGLRREDVFLTNILLDKMPEKRSPTRAEIEFYAPLLDRQIDIVQPQVIATLGRFSMDYILQKYDLPERRQSISQLHGKLLKARTHYGDIHVLPLFHPAVVLYTASKKDVLREDFQKLKMFI